MRQRLRGWMASSTRLRAPCCTFTGGRFSGGAPCAPAAAPQYLSSCVPFSCGMRHDYLQHLACRLQATNYECTCRTGMVCHLR